MKCLVMDCNNEYMSELQKEVKARNLKSILNKVSDVSLSFRDVNFKLPLSKAINENRVDEIIIIYESLIVDLVNYLRTTEYGKGENKRE